MDRTKLLVLHERELREAWEHAHLDVHTAERESLKIARHDVNRRLDEMNQMREQITRERGEFLRRELYDREHATLRDSMDARIKILEQAKSNLDGRIWAVGAVVTVVTVLIEFMLRYFMK